MNLRLSLPLTITRQWLYILTLLIAVFGVLLPISIIAYLNFYKILIPQQTTRIPLSFDVEHGKGMESQLQVKNIRELFKDDLEMKYEISLNLNIVCNKKNYDDIFNINSALTIENLFVANSSFLLNCDTRFIYNSNNWFIPYRLRFWVPPIFTNIDKLINIKSPLIIMSGRQLSNLFDGSKLTKTSTVFLDKQLIVDNNNSFLDLKIQWDGMRYYMLNYYFTSLVIGVIIFWIPSSFACLLTSMIILINSNSDQSKRKRA